VQDLQSHYRYAAAFTKKLNFLGPDHEQLPYPLWDPEIWSNLRQLGPAQKHKLVYVAADQQNQQQVIKFTKRYGWDVHRAWAAADLAPKLLSSPDQVAGRWQRVQMEYLPSSAGWLTMRFLMLPVKEQLKHAPESCVLGPAHVPDLVKKAEQLLRSAHSVHVAHGVNNARMSQYRTISNQFRTRANNIAAYRTWLRTLVSAGSKFVKYPVKLST